MTTPDNLEKSLTTTLTVFERVNQEIDLYIDSLDLRRSLVRSQVNELISDGIWDEQVTSDYLKFVSTAVRKEIDGYDSVTGKEKYIERPLGEKWSTQILPEEYQIALEHDLTKYDFAQYLATELDFRTLNEAEDGTLNRHGNEEHVYHVPLLLGVKLFKLAEHTPEILHQLIELILFDDYSVSELEEYIKEGYMLSQSLPDMIEELQTMAKEAWTDEQDDVLELCYTYVDDPFAEYVAELREKNDGPVNLCYDDEEDDFDDTLQEDESDEIDY